MELTSALLIILVVLIMYVGWTQSQKNIDVDDADNFMSCVNTNCWNNITAVDTVRLNPYYYPYSATSCLAGVKNGERKELPLKPIEVTTKAVPDHVILTN